MQQQQEQSTARMIRLEGTFDAAAMRRIAELLTHARPGDDVTIDLSKVRDIDDASIARLADWAAGPLHVQIRGLRHHQVRLLRYFGVAPAAL